MTASDAPITRAEFEAHVEQNRKQHAALAGALVEMKRAIDKALKALD